MRAFFFGNRLTKLALVATVAFTTSACWTKPVSLSSEPSSPATSSTTVPKRKVFLWSIKSPQNTVYLLGSVHLLQQNDYPLPEALETAYQDAEKLVFEVDLNQVSTPETQKMVLSKATATDGQSLQSRLSPETYQLAVEKSKTVGLPIEAMGQFEPWFFSLSLLSMKLNQLGFESQYGVDRHYLDRALQDDKEVLTLETIAEQISIFDALNAKDQEEYVRQTLLELDTLDRSMMDIVMAWKEGDLKTIETLLFESFEKYPKMRAKLFDERNQKWLKTLVPLLQKQDDYLVVVGAGHLVGNNNVLQLLKEKGYSAKQL